MTDQVFKVLTPLSCWQFPAGATSPVLYNDDILMSACVPPPHALTYEVDKTTRPTVGYIFACNSLKAASRFAIECCFNGAEIWEADAIVTNARPTVMALYIRDLHSFWDQILTSERIPDSITLDVPPYGTIWCSELTPRKKVATLIDSEIVLVKN